MQQNRKLKPIIIIPIRTRLIKPGDDIVDVIFESLEEQRIDIEEGDVFVISEKAISTSIGRLVKLEDVNPSPKAMELAKEFGMDPRFIELVVQEADEIWGAIAKYNFVLTIKDGISIANAGIDKSNAPPGYVVLMPKEPMKTAFEIKKKIEARVNKRVAVIISDSRTQPLRRGNVGIAYGIAGMEPIEDLRGKPDLFGKVLRSTWRGIADEITNAAQLVMGESDERIPVVIVRGARYTPRDTPLENGPMIMPPERCIYMNILKPQIKRIILRKKQQHRQD